MNRTQLMLQEFEKNRDWMEARIAEGIEKNRKAYGILTVTDRSGNPVPGVRIRYNLKRHEFLHGTHCFMLDEMETEEKNEKFKEYLAAVANHATLPFFWADLEPEPGKPRFSKDSPKRYRRRPIDLCMEFCERHNIVPRLAQHEIAQLNFSKKLYDQTSEIPQLEYRIIQKANRDEHGAYRKTYCELDVVHKTPEDVMTLYEIKPMGRSAKSQIEKYVEISGFSAGGWIGNIPDIEILSLKDYKICMEISSIGQGEVYYRLYNSVTNERVTNKEFVEIYDRVVLNKQQNDPIDLTTDLPSIEELKSEAIIIAIFSLAEIIFDNIYQIIDFAIENIIPCLG